MIASLLLAAAAVAALAAAAFCAGAETAFMSVNRGRVLHLAREGSAAAKVVDGALNAMNRTLTTLLIGNNLAHVVFSSAAAALREGVFNSLRDLIICFLGGFKNEEIHFLDGQVEVNGIPGRIVRWLRPQK